MPAPKNASNKITKALEDENLKLRREIATLKLNKSSTATYGMTSASKKRERGFHSGPEADVTDDDDDIRKPDPKRARVKIPRPPGEAGRKDERGFVMIEALGLADNKKKYLTILSSLRGYATSRLLPNNEIAKPYNKQDPRLLAKIVFDMVKIYPELDDYEKCWPVLDMTRTFLVTRHADQAKKARGIGKSDSNPHPALPEPEDSPIRASTSKSHIRPKSRYPLPKLQSSLSLLASPKPKANKEHRHRTEVQDDIDSNNEASAGDGSDNNHEDSEHDSDEHDDDEIARPKKKEAIVKKAKPTTSTARSLRQFPPHKTRQPAGLKK